MRYIYIEVVIYYLKANQTKRRNENYMKKALMTMM